MIPYDLDYVKVQSVADALSQLEAVPGAQILAGGHTLIPLLKLRLAQPSRLIDISGVAELQGIAVDSQSIVIGSATTHAELEASAALKAVCPLISLVGKVIADPAVRNRGTIGGALVNCDPSADWPAAMLALGAEMEVASSAGTRRIPATEFFAGLLTSALREHEILIRIHLPAPLRARVGYRKFRHPASGYAVAGAAVSLTYDNDKCTDAKIGITGVAATAFRPYRAERLLVDGFSGRPEDINAVCETAFEGVDALEDAFSSSAYRLQLGRTMLKRSLEDALAASATH